MLQSLRQLVELAARSKKIWIVPLALLLVIVALLVISAQISPVPIFIYPLI